MAELKQSALLGKTFLVGWLGGWVAENKAKAQHSWDLGLTELGKNWPINSSESAILKKSWPIWCFSTFWVSNTVFFANRPFFNRIE